MKALLSGFLFIVTSASAQVATTDTLHLCGGWTGVGAFMNGKKEGPWKYYRLNYGNAVGYKGNYISGKKEGEWQSLSGNAIYHYKNDLLDGQVIYYSPEHPLQVVETQSYKAGKADGDWISYAEDGKTKVNVNHYKNGEPTGRWEYEANTIHYSCRKNTQGYYGRYTETKNGKVIGGGNYVNGLQEGYWKDYFGENDYEEGFYQAGKKNGGFQWRCGKMFTSSYYVNGLLEGADSTWINDTLVRVNHYHLGNRTGTCLTFYPNGKLREQQAFDNGRYAGVFTAYDANGNLKASGRFQRNPVYDTITPANKEAIYFSPELELALIERNTCGVPFIYGAPFINADADSAVRFMNSPAWQEQLADSRQWIHTESYEIPVAAWTIYDENGVKKEEGEMTAPGNHPLISFDTLIKTGWWIVYDQNGKPIRREHYENGELK